MYTFKDKSDRRLCLRPEFTSSILRAYLNDKSLAHWKKSFYYVYSSSSNDGCCGEVPIDTNDHSMVAIANSISLVVKSFNAITPSTTSR